MIGYCVEYYSKWLIYGDEFLYPFIENVQKELGIKKVHVLLFELVC